MINRDALTDSGYQPSTNLLSWPHRVTGKDPMLFVGILGQSVSSDPLAAFFTSVTFGGVALTHLADGGSSERWAHLWGVALPPVGEYPVVVSMAGTSDAQAMAASYTGASVPLDAMGGGADAGQGTIIGTTPLVTVAPAAWIVGCMRMSGGVTPTPLGDVQEWARSGGFFFYDSVGDLPPGAHSLAFETTGPVFWGSASASIVPVGVVPPVGSVSLLTLLGAG